MILIFVLSGITSCISGSILDVNVKLGDNITIYCDCKLSVGALIAWYRNCSHTNQPSLALRLKLDEAEYLPNKSGDAWMRPLPRFQFVKNVSSNSYDLLITNITESDEGLYFCATETTTITEEKCLVQTFKYTYGKAMTRILFKSSYDQSPTAPDCAICWTLLFSLCPAFASLTLLLTVFLVYFVWLKQDSHNKDDAKVQTRHNEEEDVCYAALEIRRPLQRPKNKTVAVDSEYDTYSAVRTSRE